MLRWALVQLRRASARWCVNFDNAVESSAKCIPEHPAKSIPKHDLDCLRRKKQFQAPYLCTCGLTDDQCKARLRSW